MDDKTKAKRFDTTCLSPQGSDEWVQGSLHPDLGLLSPWTRDGLLSISTQHCISVSGSGLIIEILLIIVTIAVCNCSSKA